MTNKRIYVSLSQEVYAKVMALANKEKRKKSPMAAMLIEDGLKLVEPIVIKGEDLSKVINGK